MAQPKRREEGASLRRKPPVQSQAETRAAAASLSPKARTEENSAPAGSDQSAKQPVTVGARESAESAPRPSAGAVTFTPKDLDDDDLDVPDFLK